LFSDRHVLVVLHILDWRVYLDKYDGFGKQGLKQDEVRFAFIHTLNAMNIASALLGDEYFVCIFPLTSEALKFHHYNELNKSETLADLLVEPFC